MRRSRIDGTARAPSIGLAVGRCFLLSIFALVCGLPVLADRVELENGDVISGTIVRLDAERVVIENEFGRLEIPRERVVRGEFGADSERRAVDDAEDENDLIFSFPLNGNLEDETSSYTLTNNGMTFTTDHAGSEAAALASDGSGTYLSIPPAQEIDELDVFTLSFRLRLDDTSGTKYLISKWDRAEGERADGKFTVQTSGGGLTLFLVDPAGRYRWTSARGVLTPGRWHSVAFVFEAGNATIYVDGGVAANRTFAFTELAHDDSPLLVMTAVARNDRPYAFYNAAGAIDELRLHGRALSAAEVSALFSASATAGE